MDPNIVWNLNRTQSGWYSSYSQQQVAVHLGISLSALGRWVRAERKPSGTESMAKKPGLSLADQASDRGSQYASREYRQHLMVMGMEQSMSRQRQLLG